MTDKKLIASVVLNFAVFTLTSAIVVSYFLGNLTPEVNTPVEKFMFFTTDSNVLAAVGSLLAAVYNILILRGKRESLPTVILVIKLMGVVSLLLTFFTVVILLVPIYGFDMQFRGTGAHMHAGAPFASFVSFTFLDSRRRLPVKFALFGAVPMLIYAAVYLTQVVWIGFLHGGWLDFYAFNRNGSWPYSLSVMLAATLAISFGVVVLRNRFCKK